MIGIDTNVLVRHLTGIDEGDEVARAAAVLRSLTTTCPGYVTIIALLETWWVLGASYDVSAIERCNHINKMLRVRTLVFERRSAIIAALSATAAGADFADALIVAISAEENCTEILTFDQRAAKRAEMTLISSN